MMTGGFTHPSIPGTTLAMTIGIRETHIIIATIMVILTMTEIITMNPEVGGHIMTGRITTNLVTMVTEITATNIGLDKSTINNTSSGTLRIMEDTGTIIAATNPRLGTETTTNITMPVSLGMTSA